MKLEIVSRKKTARPVLEKTNGAAGTTMPFLQSIFFYIFNDYFVYDIQTKNTVLNNRTFL
jgi:hypothetical protein